MTRLPLAACLALIACPAVAGVEEAVEGHILPGFERFASEAADLAGAASSDCTAEGARPAFHEAFDAWMGVSHLGFGPVEEDGRGLAIAFWPDTRGMIPSTLARLVADEDPAAGDSESFAEVSVAGRGLYALEYLIYDEGFAGYEAGSYTCALVTAIATDLARMADDLANEWQETAGPALLTAGEAGNATYLSRAEAEQALYTALQTGLAFTAQQRLGRPLGTFDRPRPRRAEAWRSERSLRNVILSLEALGELAEALTDAPIPRTEEAFEAALEEARSLEDPTFAGVEEPASRLRVEILQQRVEAVSDAVAGEIGAELGVTEGFNATDGD
ncbi:imelysin family protein [Histidinibacterium aquaticum]|uniref:Imelysin family protein n=1 Tax=Histidinibacterium aquaticum TaxID=2613962 RepID=A0A5J5GD22_9RHOB|nr:imelysin family protein [Histidinibacterium aquaticum]KAA9006099.1 imelysin family protein [Histidinibacterium aquaticum]